MGRLAPGEAADRALVVHQAQADLLHVVHTLRPAGRFAGRLHSREQEGNQNGDDRDHDQQLDQGKPQPTSAHDVLPQARRPRSGSKLDQAR
jgi:hypothetical protein